MKRDMNPESQDYPSAYDRAGAVIHLSYMIFPRKKAEFPLETGSVAWYTLPNREGHMKRPIDQTELKAVLLRLGVEEQIRRQIITESLKKDLIRPLDSTNPPVLDD